VPVFNIQNIEKGAHLNFAMDAILHRHATDYNDCIFAIKK